MTQLVYKQNFKKETRLFFYSTILNHSQNALYVTDDSRVNDVLQLTGVIVMASSAKKKIYDSKRLKRLECTLLVTNSL